MLTTMESGGPSKSAHKDFFNKDTTMNFSFHINPAQIVFAVAAIALLIFGMLFSAVIGQEITKGHTADLKFYLWLVSICAFLALLCAFAAGAN